MASTRDLFRACWLLPDPGGSLRPPPPGRELDAALDAFEKFLHADSPLPLLVRLALVRHQFEAIHPFLDGNGRVGRILIALPLCAHDRLSQPLLYMSAYFERNREAYVDHMLHVSQRGEWRPWIHFFLQGVAEQCDDAVSRAKKLAELRDEYKRTLQRASGNVLTLMDAHHARSCPPRTPFTNPCNTST
jgi:Fic family protein